MKPWNKDLNRENENKKVKVTEDPNNVQFP